MIDRDEQIHADFVGAQLRFYISMSRDMSKDWDIEFLKKVKDDLFDAISHRDAAGFIFGDRGHVSKIKKLEYNVLSKMIDFFEVLAEQEAETPKILAEKEKYEQLKNEFEGILGA